MYYKKYTRAFMLLTLMRYEADYVRTYGAAAEWLEERRAYYEAMSDEELAKYHRGTLDGLY